MVAKIGGGNSFLIFAIMMILQFILMWKCIQETKGKSLEQFQKELGIDYRGIFSVFKNRIRLREIV